MTAGFPEGFNFDQFNRFMENVNSEHEEKKAQEEKWKANTPGPIQISVGRRMFTMAITATAADWIKILTILKEADEKPR